MYQPLPGRRDVISWTISTRQQTAAVSHLHYRRRVEAEAVEDQDQHPGLTRGRQLATTLQGRTLFMAAKYHSPFRRAPLL